MMPEQRIKNILNSSGRRKLAALQKRVDWIEKRLSGKPPEALSYDREERAALLWAIEIIEQIGAIEEDRLDQATTRQGSSRQDY